MTSDKQIEANRRNAQKSTGPRTDRGKAIVARNALRHGLTAQRVLLPDETQEELTRFVEQFWRHFQPVGIMEALLMERIIAAAWRLRRVYRIEAGVLTWQFYDVSAGRGEREAKALTKNPFLSLLGQDEVVTDEARHAAALQRAAEAAGSRDSEDTDLGAAFARDAAGANALPKLSRYEAALERGMYRALQELERLQTGRGCSGSGDVPSGG